MDIARKTALLCNLTSNRNIRNRKPCWFEVTHEFFYYLKEPRGSLSLFDGSLLFTGNYHTKRRYNYTNFNNKRSL